MQGNNGKNVFTKPVDALVGEQVPATCTNNRTRLANQAGRKPWEVARLLRTNGDVGREAVVRFQTKFANLM